MYNQLMTTASIFMNGSVTVYPALSADEIYNTVPNPTSDQFYQNAISPRESTQIQNGFWRWGYSNIFNCNSVLAGLQTSDKISSTLRNQFRGEALAIRALCYFYLTNLFGDVPLIVSVDYSENGVKGNSTSSVIYEQIVNDLKEAEALLPASYPAGRTRVTTSAARALLARVYLYLGEYVLAEQWSSTVMNNTSDFMLESDLNKVFLMASRENIFGLYPVALNQNTGDGFALLPSTAATSRPPFSLTSYLLSAFESGDKRRTNWVTSRVINGQTIFYPYKYKLKTGTPLSEINVVLRLGEQFLIRAEARAFQNNLQGALDDLNVIRKRAGLSDVTMGTQQEILDTIMHERRIELMFEKGHRWLDLKRSGKASTALAPIKTDWQNTDVLYPIPQPEIDRNPFLKQNSGY